MSEVPFVTIVIPCRNEVRYIRSFLDSMFSMNYPEHRSEIIVADGGSQDGTRDVLQEIAGREGTLRWIDNPSLTVPHGLNLAIAASRGEIIVRMDVHASYPRDYLTSLVQGLQACDADNIGVPWETTPGASTLQAHAVAAAQRSVFGIGLADYRLGVTEPMEVDSVPYGCFRREVFDKIGMFDEDMHRNQDDEFNARMKKHGMRIVLLPGPKVVYFARETILKSARMMFQYGHFKPLVNRKIGSPATLRQFVPPTFVLGLSGLTAAMPFSALAKMGLAAVLGAYLLASVLATIWFLKSDTGFRRPAAVLLPVTFFVNHVSYGMGYLRGTWDFLLLGRSPQVPKSSR